MRKVVAMIGHRPRMFRQVGLDEGDGRRVEFRVMQANVEFAVADNRILMREDVSAIEFGEAE